MAKLEGKYFVYYDDYWLIREHKPGFSCVVRTINQGIANMPTHDLEYNIKTGCYKIVSKIEILLYG